MLQRFKDSGDTRMVQQLEAAPVGETAPLPDSYFKIRDVAMHQLGVGTTHDMTSIVTGLLLAFLLNREYTISEKVAMWRSKVVADDHLWNTQLSTDRTTKVTRLDISVYVFHCVYVRGSGEDVKGRARGCTGGREGSR